MNRLVHLNSFEGVSHDGDQQVHHNNQHHYSGNDEGESFAHIEATSFSVSHCDQKGKSQALERTERFIKVHKHHVNSKQCVQQQNHEGSHVDQTFNDHGEQISRSSKSTELRKSTVSGEGERYLVGDLNVFHQLFGWVHRKIEVQDKSD